MTVRELPIKIVYTINPSPHPVVARHKRVPTTVISLPDGLNPHCVVEYGKVLLRSCLSAICKASPELVVDEKRDYTVYVLDPLEQAETPFASSSKNAPKMSPTWGTPVGMGLMSWCLAGDDEDNDDIEPVYVLGRIITHPASGQMVEVFVSLQETLSLTQQQQNKQLKSWATPAPAKQAQNPGSAQAPKRPLPTPRSTSSPAPSSSQEVVDLTGDDSQTNQAPPRAKRKPADPKKALIGTAPTRSRSSTAAPTNPPLPYYHPQTGWAYYWMPPGAHPQPMPPGMPPMPPGMQPPPMPPYAGGYPNSDPPARVPFAAAPSRAPKPSLGMPAASSLSLKPGAKAQPAKPARKQDRSRSASARPPLPVSRTQSLPTPNASSSSPALPGPDPVPSTSEPEKPSNTDPVPSDKENEMSEAAAATAKSDDKKRRLSLSDDDAEERPRKKQNSDNGAPLQPELLAAPTTPRSPAKQLADVDTVASSPLFSPGASTSAQVPATPARMPVTPARNGTTPRIFGSAGDFLSSFDAIFARDDSSFSPLRDSPRTLEKLAGMGFADMFSSSPIARNGGTSGGMSWRTTELGLPPSSPLPPTSSPMRVASGALEDDEKDDETPEVKQESPFEQVLLASAQSPADAGMHSGFDVDHVSSDMPVDILAGFVNAAEGKNMWDSLGPLLQSIQDASQNQESLSPAGVLG